MRDRYPGYDVLAKRNTPSWNEQTRACHRRAAGDRPRPPRSSPTTNGRRCWRSAAASCRNRRTRAAGSGRRDGRREARSEAGDGYRDRRLPPSARPGGAALRALDAEAHARYGSRVPRTRRRRAGRDAAAACRTASCTIRAWGDMPPALFFTERLAARHRRRLLRASRAWNEIGFGGPASPRGYVRMDFDRRDPWEAVEARPGREDEARRGKRSCRMIVQDTPRASDGRAPDVFRPGGWMPMRQLLRGRGGRFRHRRHRRRRRHARLQARRSRLLGRGVRRRPLLAAAGGFRLRRERAGQALLDRRAHRRRRQSARSSARNNSGKSVGGSTVHFAMVSLRFRPEWFRSRSLLGYGADWPLDWREMWRYYARGRAGAEDLRAGDAIPGGRSGRAILIARMN